MTHALTRLRSVGAFAALVLSALMVFPLAPLHGQGPPGEAAPPPPMQGQMFQGRVLEDGEGVPVAEVWVEVLDAQGRSVVRNMTDEEGGFQVAVPAPGTYRLRASRVGYEFSVTDPVDLEAGQTERVFISLVLRPFVLDSMVVAGARRPGARSPGREKYAYRQTLAQGGVFLTRQDIQGRPAYRLSEIIRTVDGFLLSGNGELRPAGGQGCLVVFLNDIPMRNMAMDEIPPEDVEGIEAYRRFSEIPDELKVHAPSCGAVNVWTRGAW